MDKDKLIAITIASIIFVCVLVFFIFQNIEEINLTKKYKGGECYSAKEFEAKCNELCDKVNEEFCFDTMAHCQREEKVTCLDLNIECGTIDCFEDLAA